MAEFEPTSTHFSVPQHPLPDEIQKMERDETICKFCGVSYLIHNEVKALQEKLAEAERTMEYYKGSVEREKILIEKVQQMEAKFTEQSNILKEQEQQLQLFKGDLKMKANLVNDLYSQKQKTKKELEQSQLDTEKLKTQLSHLVIVLPKLKDIVKEQKHSLDNLRNQATQQKQLSKDKVKLIRNEFEKVIRKIVTKVQNERKTANDKVQNLSKQLSGSQKVVDGLRDADKQLTDLQTKCNNLQNKIVTYEKEQKTLKEQNNTMKEKCSTLEKKLDIKSNETTKLQSEIELLTTEKKYDQLNFNENITKKDEEITKLNLLCKSLEKLMNEKSAAEIEIKEKVTDKDIEVKALHRSLSQAKLETENLKLEREQTILSHHNRIEQLRDSYSKKLGDTETSYSKLRQEFDHQQKVIEKDFEEAKTGMKLKFEKEKEDLITDHNRQLGHLQTEIRECKEKLEEEETVSKETKEQFNELKNALSTNKTKNAQEIQKYQNELLELRRKLEKLEEERRQQSESNGEINYQKYKNVQKLLQNANTEIKMLKEKLKTNKDEMSILQNTVRQECEERLELTQALSNARMQLLSSQQNSGAPRHSPTTTKLNQQRLTNRQSITTKSANLGETSKTDLTTSVIDFGQEERRTKSTGSDTPRPSRESVDSFRERIAVALGRPNRGNVTR